jgi:hypothetical protein
VAASIKELYVARADLRSTISDRCRTAQISKSIEI